MFVHLRPVRLFSTDGNALPPPGDKRHQSYSLLGSWLPLFFFFLTSHLYPDKQIVAKGCNLPWSGLRKEAMGVPVTRPAEWLREPYTPQAGGQEAP